MQNGTALSLYAPLESQAPRASQAQFLEIPGTEESEPTTNKLLVVSFLIEL